MSTPGRVLFTLVGLVTSLGPYLADWNETHIYNPLWPPHAKFHNGQTMSMGLLLGLCTTYYAWRSPPTSDNLKSSPARSRLTDVNTAAVFGTLYFLTQLSAFAYPDSLPFDTGDWNPLKAPQTYISLSVLSCNYLAWRLERSAVLATLSSKRK